MFNKISTVILTESEQTRNVLSLYLQEFGKFTYLEDVVDFSEIFNILSSLPKSVLLVDVSLNQPKYINFTSRTS